MTARILYVGELQAGGTCLQRKAALVDLGCEVTAIDTRPDWVLAKERQFLQRVRRKLRGPKDLAGANDQALRAMECSEFDLLWVDKGLAIEPATLAAFKNRFPAAKVVGYSPDDMMNPNNQSRPFFGDLPLYDVYFTTKTYGVRELQEIGCRRAVFVGNAFDPHTHRPVELTQADREQFGGGVGFIGQWEEQRDLSIRFLARAGIEVRVWGDGWRRRRGQPPCMRLSKSSLWADNYAKAICALDINLGFLRKVNRDRQTQRSIEIPACGGFMLAERTEEHLSLFEEGREAEFFASDEELLEKTKYYLLHPAQRKKIAQAGRQRCLQSGYSNHDRLRMMLGEIEGLRP